MPDFSFEALAPSGDLEEGTMTATDEDELADLLRDRGWYLVRTGPAEEARPTRRRVTDGKLRREEILAFTDYLAGSTEVGIPLVESLTDVRERIASRRMRAIIGEVVESMSEHGMSLSDALSEHPKAFSRLFVGTVAAGEATGHLDFALRQLAEYIDWQEEISVQIRQALLYPALLVTVVVALMVTLIMFVYPRILPVVLGYGVELPWPTVVLRDTADFLNQRWYVALAGLGAAFGAGWAVRRTGSGRLAMDSIALRLPIFGPLIHRINMARVATYFALFYRTGVELILSLDLVRDMIENRRVANAIGNVRERVLEGETMTAAFAADPVFPPEVVRAISLGESTGTLDETLGRVRAYYAREVPASVKRMLTALQPVLIVFLGALILGVALSVILPIVGIYENLGGIR